MAEEVAAAPSPNRVYVHNLPWELTNQELAEHMNSAGVVRYASIMTLADGRSKGCAIVEYTTPEEAANAIGSLHNSELKGRPILVREDRGQQARDAAAAPRGRGRGRGGFRGGRGGAAGGDAAAPGGFRGGRGGFRGGRGGAAPRPAPAAGGAGPRGPPGSSLWVGNLAWDVQWQDLKDAFAEFHPTYADVKFGQDGRSRGWGVVRFADAEIARNATAAMNGVEVHGRAIEVREDRGPASGAAAAGEQ